MFGFVVANPDKLTEEQKIRYKAVYCGLCEDLGCDRGFKYRMTLTYDLAFLAIVLSSVTGEAFIETDGRCPVHPARKRKYLRNRFTAYAADMNIALAYYKYIDDRNDDRSLWAHIKAELFKKEAQEIFRKYPLQCDCIVRSLDELTKTERADVLVPDVPADIFGELLGGIFAYEGSGCEKEMYDFGKALGRFIYVLDAASDLKNDIKKQRYNPFVQYTEKDTEPVLQMIMAECVDCYRKLPVKQDSEIIENILFSGIWTSFDARKKGKKSE